MRVSRRSVLFTGGACALVSGAGLVGMAHGPGLAQARQPWTQAGESFGDPRLDALAYAILAPNPHNRQPWMFHLVDADQIDVYCDLDKRLPHTDPFDRQITIGFGCMLELLRLAAAQAGFEAVCEPFPDGDEGERLTARRLARVRFVAAADLPQDPLFAAVLQRRSTKEPFDTSRPVAPETLDTLLASANTPLGLGATVEADAVARLRALAWQGFMIEMQTDRTRRESVDLMRIGNRAVVDNPDGIDMGGVAMGLMKMAGLVTPARLDRPGTMAYETGLDMYRDIIGSAMGFTWITAPDASRANQLLAGRAWVRINLAAQAIGLCIHPMSQVLQEYPEMAGPYAEVRDVLGVSGPGVVHMLGRLGYTRFPAPSPRWPLQSKLIQPQA